MMWGVTFRVHRMASAAGEEARSTGVEVTLSVAMDAGGIVPTGGRFAHGQGTGRSVQ